MKKIIIKTDTCRWVERTPNLKKNLPKIKNSRITQKIKNQGRKSIVFQEQIKFNNNSSTAGHPDVYKLQAG